MTQVVPEGYRITFLSCSAEHQLAFGDSPETPYSREQLQLLHPAADVVECTRYFNRLAAARGPFSRLQALQPLDDGRYSFDHIIAWRSGRQGPEFLVKWSGYTFEDSGWVNQYVLPRLLQHD